MAKPKGGARGEGRPTQKARMVDSDADVKKFYAVIRSSNAGEIWEGLKSP